MVQPLVDAINHLIVGVVSLLIGPTIVLLLLKVFLPALGNPLWRGYCQLLTWLVVGPIRLIRLLVREAMGRRHR